MKARLVLVSAVLAAVSPAIAAAATSTKQGVEQPSLAPILGTDTVQGCFSSKGNLKLNGTNNFNSQGACTQACRGIGAYVAASQAESCYCGSKYPAEDTHVADSKCAEPCPGFGTQACGGLGTYTVYNTGVMVEVAFEANGTGDDSDASSTAADSSTATTAAPSVVTVSGTVVVTSAPSTTGTTKKSSGSTAGIAVGAALGACAAAVGVGAVFFFIRRKRNREIEEEHQRQAAVNSFINSDKPGSSGGLSMSDARLDPVMAQRRMSDGSIADNEDYSRRILRVTNA